MHTLIEEFRDSDDDWYGIAYGQNRTDGNSLRAYLQRAKAIPPEHVIVGVTVVLRSIRPPKGLRPPFLRIFHFDPGQSTDPPRMYKEQLDAGNALFRMTIVPCGEDLLDTFADLTIELTAREYGVEPPPEM